MIYIVLIMLSIINLVQFIMLYKMYREVMVIEKRSARLIERIKGDKQ